MGFDKVMDLYCLAQLAVPLLAGIFLMRALRGRE
jgi:hypothetical protein